MSDSVNDRQWGRERGRRRGRLKECQTVWDVTMKLTKTRWDKKELHLWRNKACPFPTSKPDRRCHRDVCVRGGTQHDHLSVPVRTKCSYLLVFLKLKDLQNLKLSSPRYSCLSTWCPYMAGYSGLRVPARSYSRFSCEAYKVVRNQGVLNAVRLSGCYESFFLILIYLLVKIKQHKKW